MNTSVLIHTLSRKSLHLPRFLRKQFYVKWNRVMIRLSIGWKNLGKKAEVHGHIYLDIHPESKVRIGDDFIFTSGECINPLCRNQRGCIVTERAESVIEIETTWVCLLLAFGQRNE